MADDEARRDDGRFAALDGARGLALLGVIGYHSAGATGLGARSAPVGSLWGVAGNGGLYVFFVLSSFLLHRQLLVAARQGQRRSPFGFWWRRLVRIYPAWWAVLVLSSIWPGTGNPFRASWWREWTLLQTAGFDGFRNGALAHSWSLGAELGFYAVLPGLVWLGQRWRRGVAGHVAVGGALVAAGTVLDVLVARGEVPGWYVRTPLAVAGCFGLGIVLSVTSVRWPLDEPPAAVRAIVRWRTATACALSAAIGVVAVAVPAEMHTDVPAMLRWRGLLVAIAGIVVVLAVWAPPAGVLGRVLRHPVTVRLGIISYGAYLWHHPVVLWLGGVDAALPTSHWSVRVPGALGIPAVVTIGLACVVLSSALGALSYRLLERPLLDRWSTGARALRRGATPVGSSRAMVGTR